MPAFEFSQKHKAFVKECSSCKEAYVGTSSQIESERLFLKNFIPRSSNIDGLDSLCKRCHTTSARISHLMRKYNITTEEFEVLWNGQGGLCGICQEMLTQYPEPHSGTSACVDHIEGTDIISGLLCHSCNSAIGLLKHKPDTITRARDWCSKRVLLEQPIKKVG